MATINKNTTPFEATHPGILIKDELDVRKDLNQKALANLLDVKPSFLNEIIKGKRPITADMSVLLEKALNIPAEYWMKFQSQYEIDTAKIKEKNIEKLQLIEYWKIILMYVPIKYFRKKGYLGNNLKDDIEKIKEIYSVSTIDKLVDNVTAKKYAFFRKSEKLDINENNMIAWSSLTEYEAAKTTNINTFNSSNIKQLCKELNNIFYENKDTVSRVRKILNQYGIIFLRIEKLEKTPIDGYSFWSKNNPVIAVTLRHSSIDNFAFTIMHELGHISLHLNNNKEQRFLDLDKMETNFLEEEANNFAQGNLISDPIWSDIIKNHISLNDENIVAISTKYKIHPAIILGRICYEKDNYALNTTIDKNIN